MPWLRLDDVGYDDPQVRAVGNAAYGALTRLRQYASAQRTDGWIPASKAKEIASRAELRALTTVRVGDGPPMLHSPGDDCECLESVTWTAEQGGYWAHGHLDRNPSRSENDVHKAKQRELKDKELRHAVKSRDGDRCRYCSRIVKWADRKSASGGVLDHVDPTVAGGAENLVVACRGCNSHKRDCTPAAAGMDLLPPPGADPDPTHAEPTPDPRTTHAEPGSDPDPTRARSDTGTATTPETDSPPKPDVTSDPTPEPHPVTSGTDIQTTTTGATQNAMTVGTGRGGPGTGTGTDRPRAPRAGDAGPTGRRPTTGPATTPRSQLGPNPYLRTPNPAAGTATEGGMPR
ncbi:hypothetical protein SAMN04487819_11694 [Actinopolyspora alba]|uniref:HNH endonuclease n=1 Tax=Actinopolyspora alba TaxID=673379 RepID=A0A1I2BH71_9ACTN|nr:hypothetical protein [Actinopolyspora alba]SFE55287.1 hypothetical protein SAMN04487819_11694 [Actinopolyspora alba]